MPEEVSLINPVPEAEPAPDSMAEEPAAEAPPEMEAFYTFTWAPKPRERPARPERAPRADRGPRPDRGPRRDAPAAPAAPAVEGEAAAPAPDAPRPPRHDRRPDRPKDGEGRREGYQGKPKEGGKPGGRPYEGSKPRFEGKGDRPDRGPRKDDSKSKTYEARPPRVEKPIDPDNPFAALLALKAKL